MERESRAELQRLICRLADGDREAFHPAFALLWPVLRTFAARALDRDADADDAAQAALLKIFGRAAQFDPARQALPWVLAIAANECRTVRKARARRREDGERDWTGRATSAASPEEALIQRNLLAAAAEVLGTLRPADAEALLLLDDRPAGAAFRKRLQRALSRFRTAWRTRHGDD